MFLYGLCNGLGDWIDFVSTFEIWDWDKLDDCKLEVREFEDCKFEDCEFDDNDDRDEFEVRLCKFVCEFIRECCLSLCLGCREISKLS